MNWSYSCSEDPTRAIFTPWFGGHFVHAVAQRTDGVRVGVMGGQHHGIPCVYASRDVFIDYHLCQLDTIADEALTAEERLDRSPAKYHMHGGRLYMAANLYFSKGPIENPVELSDFWSVAADKDIHNNLFDAYNGACSSSSLRFKHPIQSIKPIQNPYLHRVIYNEGGLAVWTDRLTNDHLLPRRWPPNPDIMESIFRFAEQRDAGLQEDELKRELSSRGLDSRDVSLAIGQAVGHGVLKLGDRQQFLAGRAWAGDAGGTDSLVPQSPPAS